MKKKLLSLTLASSLAFCSISLTACRNQNPPFPNPEQTNASASAIDITSDSPITSNDFLLLIKKAFPESEIPEMTYADDHLLYEDALKVLICTLGLKSAHAPDNEIIAYAIDSGITEGLDVEISEKISLRDASALINNALNLKKSITPIEMEAKNSRSLTGMSFSANAPEGAVLDGFSDDSISESEILYSYVEEIDYNSLDSEEYASTDEYGFKNPALTPLSTFSADVDTASYSNIRRFILNGALPPTDAVRTEEIINYFDYDLPTPEDGTPFSVTTELHKCPWNTNHLLLMLAVKGDEIVKKTPQNLVFLIDTSGSMHQDNRLPLIQQSMELLLNELSDDDTVTIITYAGSSGYALEPTKAKDKEKIMEAINSLTASGSTNGEAGIRLAYDAALANKVDGNNRIILCTDGDFNMGIYDNARLEDLIEEKRDLGIYLTVLGFGMGNYKDSRMELLADKGNGNYAYIDTLKEAKRVLSDKLTGTLYTIADDVKFQTEFNPEKVSSYRLLGYENRHLEAEDFENDKKDAGEVGSGHTLIVLYEIEPGDATSKLNLKYQSVTPVSSEELLTFRIRWKNPGADESLLKEVTVFEEISENTSANFALAAGAAEFSLILKDSEFKGDASYESLKNNLRIAKEESDSFGIRNEFFQLADLASMLHSKDICGYPKNEN